MARVEQLLDEVSIIKDQYWDLYKEIQDKVKENDIKLKEWDKKVKETVKELEIAEKEAVENPGANTRMKLRNLRKKLDFVSREPKYPTYITARIDALKAILDRVDKESKLLNIFNPQALIEKNYVSLDVLKSVMEVFKGIVIDLIPEEKRGYAFKRLKTIDIQALNGEDVVEAEFTETRPKKVEVKEIDDEEIDI